MAKYRDYIETRSSCLEDLSERLSLHFGAQVLETHVIDGAEDTDNKVYLKIKGHLSELDRRDLLENVAGGTSNTFFLTYNGWYVGLKREQERAASLDQS